MIEDMEQCKACGWKQCTPAECLTHCEILKGRTKPTLGLTPRYVRDAERIREIVAAVGRYMGAGLEVRREWIEEYNELIRRNAGGKTR